jgi:DNA modification methylase
MLATKKNKTKNATAAPALKAKKPAGGKKARATKPTLAAGTVAPPKQTTVNITEAKGRPMLSWVGKRPLRHVIAFPAQLVEKFTPDISKLATKPTENGLLFHGDNKEVLAHLLANGFRRAIKLIYIDPPFNTGVDYVRKVTLRGVKMEKLEGESYSFTEQVQYQNSWNIDAYLQFLYERLQIAKEVLADNGMIFIRMDVHFGYYLRMVADEVFGQDHFQNEIIVNRIKKNVTDKGRRTIPNAVDYLYVFFKSSGAEYYDVLRQLPQTRPGYWHNMDSPGIPGPRSLDLGGKTFYPSPGTHFKFPQEQAEERWNNKKIRANPKTGILEYWVEDKDEENLDSNWTDIPGYAFSTGYPTENSEPLLERVIKSGSKSGDLILDFFVGSGTTVALAQKLGRRWIGCDINKGSIQTTTKRLQNIITEQIESIKIDTKQKDLIADDKEKSPPAAQLSFAVHRVNDYDLAIQHNEAVNLACEHIGITRTRNDSFFDGSIGQRLAKIIPFGHPLSVPDLEDLKKELSMRPNEERDVVVVCLGKELTVDAWLTDWNRLRKRGDVPNKIEIIELRTDPKYGKFIAHQPIRAKVDIARKADKLVVEIKDFISPSIIERLQSQAGLLQPKIDDWRAMVDCVMIDPAHDGTVFNIALADVPEKKADFVQTRYELAAPKGKTTVAVKITDMLGEEVLVTKEV